MDIVFTCKDHFPTFFDKNFFGTFHKINKISLINKNLFFFINFFSNSFGSQMMPALFFGEMSNPFGILNKYFKIANNKRLEKIYGLLFVVSFLIVRVIITPFLAIPIFFSETPLVFKLCVSSMWFIGLNWAFMMVNKAAKQLSETFKSFEGVYRVVRSLRKFTMVYNLLCVVLCYCWIVMWHFGIWKE